MILHIDSLSFYSGRSHLHGLGLVRRLLQLALPPYHSLLRDEAARGEPPQPPEEAAPHPAVGLGGQPGILPLLDGEGGGDAAAGRQDHHSGGDARAGGVFRQIVVAAALVHVLGGGGGRDEGLDDQANIQNGRLQQGGLERRGRRREEVGGRGRGRVFPLGAFGRVERERVKGAIQHCDSHGKRRRKFVLTRFIDTR